jgi:hypothetical protein
MRKIAIAALAASMLAGPAFALAASPAIACSDETFRQLRRAAEQAHRAAIDASKLGLEADERGTADYMEAVGALQDCAAAQEAGDYR